MYKTLFRKIKTAVFAATAAVFFVSIPQTEVNAYKVVKSTETHEFELYNAPSKKDPYSLMYPITVTKAGKIKAILRVRGGKIKVKGKRNMPFRVKIVDARGISRTSNKISKKYTKKTVYFKSRSSIEYAVDDLYLRQSKGKFVIILSNMSTKSTGTGTISLFYAGKKSNDKKKRRTRRKKD